MRVTRLFDWYLHSRLLGVVLFAAGTGCMGVGVAQAVASPQHEAVVATTHTLTDTTTRVVHHTRLVTVRVKGRVLRRHDHVLVVQVPRVVFVNHVTHKRVVVPPHVVRIFKRPATPTSPPVALVQGVAPPPVTLVEPVTTEVTVEVPVPLPPVTVTSVQTVTSPPVTLPQETTTVYVTVTEPPPTG